MSARSQTTVGAATKNVGAILRELAEPCDRSEKIHDIIERAARRAGIGKWRMFNLWYGKAGISADEKLLVASALEKKRREQTRRELHDLRTRIAALEARLVQADSDFHRVDIDGLGEVLRANR